MELHVIVDYLDGTQREARVLPIDMWKFEQKFNVPAVKIGQEYRLEWVYYLAHTCLMRESMAGNGAATKPFDGWLAEIANVRLEDRDAPPLGGTA